MANTVRINIPPDYIQYYLSEIIPDEFEVDDWGKFRDMMEKYLSEQYPEFEPQIVRTINKEYYLPALKVLRVVNGEFYSPKKEDKWVDMELKARCRVNPDWSTPMFKKLPNGDIDVVVPSETRELHQAPHEGCDCGIYGSVNVEEIYSYIQSEKEREEIYSYIQSEKEREKIPHPTTLRISDGYEYNYEEFTQSPRRERTYALCVIEPAPGAKVVLCRKGWKASHAFISEVIGDTITIRDAGELLNFAWQRDIDIRRLYEGR